jgi:hypothetical protein
MMATFIGAMLAVPTARLARGLLQPPVGWDALNYHLVKAARYVVGYGWNTERLPDILGAYEFFPDGGSIIWAWVFLPFHGDAAVAIGGAFFWSFGVVATFALAREFGAQRRPALMAAIAVGAFPAAVNFLSSGYIDNLTWATVVAGCGFAARYARTGNSSDAFLAVAGLAVASSTKAIALPGLFVGIAILVGLSWRRQKRLSVRLIGAGTIVIALIGLPSYLWSWMQRGQPLYPLGMRFAGRSILVPSDAEEEEFRPWPGTAREVSMMRVAREMVRESGDIRVRRQGDALNLGPGAIPVLLGALTGTWCMLKRDKVKGKVAAAAVALAATVGVVAGGSAFLTSWLQFLGRFLLPIASIGAGICALNGLQTVAVLCVVSGILSLTATFPVAWLFSPFDILSVAVGLAVLGGIGVSLWLTRWAMVGPRQLIALLGAWTVGLGTLAGWSEARAWLRYDIYRQCADLKCFEVTTLAVSGAQAWPIWQYLDGPGARTIAVASGWSGESRGSRWYRYPYYGSRLQNKVVYASPTTEGDCPDFARFDAWRFRANRGAWLSRIRELNVDYVVSLPPHGPEKDWMLQSPGAFERVSVNGRGDGLLFRVLAMQKDSKLAAVELAAGRPTL